MWHRHQMLPHFAGVGGGENRTQVQADLMAEEIEIDPCFSAAALGATQEVAVKRTGLVEVIDVIGEVENTHQSGPLFVGAMLLGHRNSGGGYKKASLFL